MAAYILLDIQTDPNRLEEMRSFLHDRMPEAMAFDGCLGVDLIENIEKPGNLLNFFFYINQQVSILLLQISSLLASL